MNNEEYQARIEELERRDKEHMEMWLPIMSFCQDNGEALGLRMGDSISQFVLRLLREKVPMPFRVLDYTEASTTKDAFHVTEEDDEKVKGWIKEMYQNRDTMI